jgi:hypothetical protein
LQGSVDRLVKQFLEVNEDVRLHSNCMDSRWPPSSARRQFGSNNIHPFSQPLSWVASRKKNGNIAGNAMSGVKSRKNRCTNRSPGFLNAGKLYRILKCNAVRCGAGSESGELIENVSLAAEGMGVGDWHVIYGIRAGLHVTVPNDSSWQKARWR